MLNAAMTRQRLHLALFGCGLAVLVSILIFQSVSTSTTTTLTIHMEDEVTMTRVDTRTKQRTSSTGRNSIANTTSLWLVTCETRSRNPNLSLWMATAKHYRDFYKENTKISSTNDDITIHIHNACRGSKYKRLYEKKLGNWIKLLATYDFLIALRQEMKQESTSTFSDEDKTFILFSDSDAFFSYTVAPKQLLERYSLASHQQEQYHPIVIAAEPACWVGQRCTSDDIKALYPHVQGRSNCPQFLNSAQYMGPLSQILDMLDAALHTIDLADVRGRSKSDQARLSYWHSLHPDKAVLDTHMRLFRSIIFGMVDKTITKTSGKPNPPQCGDLHGKACGWGGTRYGKGFINNNNGDDAGGIEMEVVPECEFAETKPFVIHGNGPAKKYYKLLADNYTQANQILVETKK